MTVEAKGRLRRTIIGSSKLGKPPRPARWRSVKRQLARSSAPADLAVRPLQPLGFDAVIDIVATLPAIRDVFWTARSLQDIAGTYIRQRGQPDIPRDHARYQLKRLAYDVARLLEAGEDQNAMTNELRPQVHGLAQDAINALLRTISDRRGSDWMRSLSYLHSGEAEWALVGVAAEEALGFIKGKGDYSDPTLSLAIQNLVATFEGTTGRKATWSRRLAGPIGKNGGGRQIASSDCGRFILCFFEHVAAIRTNDAPAVEPITFTKITNKLRAYLTARA